MIYFRPFGIGHVIVSVKGGENLNPGMVRDLKGTVDGDEAQLELMVCLNEPTSGMRQTAAGYGMVVTAHGRFPKIQIVTVDRLLDGYPAPVPPSLETAAFRRPLRPQRRARVPAPTPQLPLPLPITGGGARKRGRSTEEFLSGAVIADLARG